MSSADESSDWSCAIASQRSQPKHQSKGEARLEFLGPARRCEHLNFGLSVSKIVRHPISVV
jgi:hypothetical protein